MRNIIVLLLSIAPSFRYDPDRSLSLQPLLSLKSFTVFDSIDGYLYDPEKGASLTIDRSSCHINPSRETKEKEILWNAVYVVVVMEEQLLPEKVNDVLYSAVLRPKIITKNIKETVEKDVLVYYWIMQYQIIFGQFSCLAFPLIAPLPLLLLFQQSSFLSNRSYC